MMSKKVPNVKLPCPQGARYLWVHQCVPVHRVFANQGGSPELQFPEFLSGFHYTGRVV